MALKIGQNWKFREPYLFLAQVDVALFLIKPKDLDDVCLSDPDVLVDRPDTPSAQLCQWDHPFDVVVFEQLKRKRG